MKIFNIIAAGVLMVMGSLSAQGQTTLPEPKKNDVSIGNVKLSRDDKDLALDFGKITQSGAKQIRYNVEWSKERLAGRAIRFT